MRASISALVAVLISATCANAQAVDARCPAASGSSAVSFDHQAHRNWYRRFWTGACSGLGMFDGCMSGSPNWREVIDRAEATGNAQTLARACRLGRTVGHEWARDNNVRRIDTNDLRGYYAALAGASSFDRGLTLVEQRAAAALGS